MDYRRVNARVLRNSYYSRKSSEVIAEASGSAYLTLLDAVTGFNQVENTERAKQVLALVSRGGQFLPTCLTFGPQNGPEDFAFVVDRIYAPGRHRRLRLMKEWLPYVDDLTIRTGRVLDGVIYKDSEVTARVREAVSVANVSEQDIGEVLKACGFSSKGLSKEKSKTEPDRDQRPELRSEEKVAAVRAEGVGRRVPPRLSKGKVTGVMGKEKEDPLETPFLGSLRTPEALEVCLAAASACWEVQGRNGPLHDRSRLSVRADAPEWGFGPARGVGNWSGPRSPRKASTGSEDGESEECGRQPPPTKKMAGEVKEKEEEPSAETVRLSHRLTALLRHGKVHGKRMAVKVLVECFDSKGWVRASRVVEWLRLPQQGVVETLQAAVDCSGARLETGRTQAGAFMLRARHSWSMDHVFDGLAEAAEQDEPIQLFHGTTWKAWAGIGRSCLKSEQQLKGGTGRIHVHLARTPFSVRPGSEVIICINTQTLFKLAKGYRMPVLANEKAVYGQLRHGVRRDRRGQRARC